MSLTDRTEKLQSVTITAARNQGPPPGDCDSHDTVYGACRRCDMTINGPAWMVDRQGWERETDPNDGADIWTCNACRDIR